MMKFNAIYKPNQLICGTGQTAIVTGWTDRNLVGKHLEPRQYGAIGQLYSPVRGINFLVRNLLANPHIRSLVLLAKGKEDKNAGSVECLLWFLHYGVQEGETKEGRKAWVIACDWPSVPGTDLAYKGEGYIDREIPLEDLEHLRRSLHFVLTRDISKAVISAINFSKTTKQPWGAPKAYPLVEPKTTILPGPRYAHRIEGKTVAETWVKILHRIRTTGTLRPTGYDGQWQELIGLTAVVTDEPMGFYFPEPNYLPVDREAIARYLPEMLEDGPYQEGIKYTYAQRMRSWFGCDQIEEVICKLAKEIDAASAVISLWDSGGNVARRADGSSDHQHGGSPCLNHIWARVVEGELSLHATFRSNDMFAAWPSNAMGLRALQEHICKEVSARSPHDLRLGPLITNSLSAHIYDDCFATVDEMIRQQYVAIASQRDYADPVGNYIVEYKGFPGVRVERTTPEGEVVATYESDNCLAILRAIARDAPGMQVEHALYLGAEISTALIQKNNYVQDRLPS